MDLNLAQQFLNQLHGSENPLFAFRTFQDDKDSKEKNPLLTTTRHGHFPDLQDEFVRLNTSGAGIFYNVNITDGKGFSAANIIRIRAVFADLDGAPLEPAAGFKLTPQIVVESSKGRYHCIWLIDHEKSPLALPMFEPIQSRIAELFNSDKTVKDLPRVLRLPGFYHRKKEPFLVNLVSTHDTPPRYSAEQILDAFGITKTGKTKTLPIAIPIGQQETRLVSFLGSMRRAGASEESMMAAIQIENQRCIPLVQLEDLHRMVRSVARYATTEGDFIRDKDGKIYPNNQQNIKIALEKMSSIVKYNVFANQHLISRDGGSDQYLDDPAITRLWLEGDEAFRFRPSYEFFQKVVIDMAVHKGKFHPVMDYLKSLKWDGVERIEDWLVNYGEAADSEYVRTVGKLVLLAAVRRVKQPGCLFQEMLVLESPQGKEKSTVLKSLCPNEDWFSDGLPLDADAQKTIEQTSGKWIVEVAELSGLKKSDIEHVKNFLSQTHDVARMAYDRMVTTRPRHFIMIGTTNSNQYLKDATGNRRFWPVRTPQFNVKKLSHDRDQLWAEAVQKEPGASIRLPQHLWSVAEIQQERRRIDDPWESRIVQTIGDMRGRILTEDVWKIVGMFDVARRSQNDNIRIGDALRRLGFDRLNIRLGDKIKHGYQRADSDLEKKQFIKIRINDGEPEAYLESRATVMEWEKPAPVEGGNNEEAKT